jgi:UDP-N-acetylmuramoylalanine--D-glutamate ligase
MKVLVLGAAVSGRAAARLARRLGHEVAVYDQRADAVVDLGDDVEVHADDWRSGTLAGVDLVVTSPGFPEHTGPIPDVVSVDLPLVSEMEFAAAQLMVPYGAVTGTNGKTTVTTVAADMLSASGVVAIAAGNIGTALSDVALEPPAVVVIEASSFQLRFIDQFHPKAAAILNIAPDHLDWHHGFDEYVAAKQRISENQITEDILAFDVDDDGARRAVAAVATAAQQIPVSGSRLPVGGNGPDESSLVIGQHRVPRPNLDRAFTMDLVAAATIASHLGATTDGIEQTIARFVPGDHRRRIVGFWDGVTWINDSKATNPHAAVASVEAYDSVVLIAGGRNKGLDLSPIVLVPSLRAIVGIGEAAPELEAVTDPGRYSDAADMEEAIGIADAIAQPGDTVLLAPGCASFDMFDSYATRGDVFSRLVRKLKGGPNGI